MDREIILQKVRELREHVPGMGTRKLLHILQKDLKEHGIKIGRDSLFDMLRDYNLLIRQRRRKAITTNSKHRFYKFNNLIKELNITGPEQVWVCDITYIRILGQWGYLSLITDAYSRKIMGFYFSTDLTTEGSLEALKMALSKRIYTHPLIHHSDRGIQYCSKAYVSYLLENNILISMTEKGDPYENAIAERLNGILKTDFNFYDGIYSFEITKSKIEKSIKAYNEIRPHLSCDNLTPNQAHYKNAVLRKRWKNYNRKRYYEKATV